MSFVVNVCTKFNLELFKTLILNLACIHFKRTKLGMFIFHQKCQFISIQFKQSKFATDKEISCKNRGQRSC